MKSFSIYLNFDGRTEEAFNFYRSVFGGDLAPMRYKEMPDTSQVSPADREKIMHVALPLGKTGMIMGSDVPESMRGNLKIGTNTYIMIEAESEGEAQTLFSKLSAGGTVEMALQKTFWGALYASFSDRFGVQRMINYTYPQP